MEINITKHAAARFFNLPPATTPTQFCDWLYAKVGLCIGEDAVEIRQVPNGAAAVALVAISRTAIANFLDLAIQQAGPFDGRTITVRPMKKPNRKI